LKVLEFLQNNYPHHAPESVACDLGLCYFNLRENDKAIQHFEKSISLKPTSLAYYNLGVVYATMDNGPKAMESYKASLELDPNNFKAWTNLGLEYEYLGNLVRELNTHLT
jgi:tetratricopeptide (TPR) repeat protein